MNVAQKLKEIADKGKICGSWLFCGPFGIGKHETAAALAGYLTNGVWAAEKKINPQIMWLERSLTEEAKKEIQKAILAGQAVEENAKTQSRKKEITVDDIRACTRFLSLKPGKNEYRILILSLAEDMNTNAANALLKILEEPFERSVLILITENAGKLLPTICSRCRRVDFPLIPEEEIEKTIKTEYPGLDCALISSLSGGSAGMARLICENGGLEIYQKLSDFLACSLAQMPLEDLDGFADSVQKNEVSYKLFKTFLLQIISQNAKKRTVRQERLSGFYFETQELLQKTGSLYLDEKQNIINILLRYAREFNK